MSFILDLVEQELEIDTEKVSEDLNHLQKKISNHKSTRDTAKFIYVLICNFTAINKILFVHNSKDLILQGKNNNFQHASSDLVPWVSRLDWIPRSQPLFQVANFEFWGFSDT